MGAAITLIEEGTIMMEKIIQLQLKAESFLKREDGASAIEYAIIAGLIAVAIITAATLLGDNMAEVFNKIAVMMGKVDVK